ENDVAGDRRGWASYCHPDRSEMKEMKDTTSDTGYLQAFSLHQPLAPDPGRDATVLRQMPICASHYSLQQQRKLYRHDHVALLKYG
ncbi:MAG: hypothetical protein ABGZ35_32140, partial [Planctomycetaceae bacterium]